MPIADTFLPLLGSELQWRSALRERPHRCPAPDPFHPGRWFRCRLTGSLAVDSTASTRPITWTKACPTSTRWQRSSRKAGPWRGCCTAARGFKCREASGRRCVARRLCRVLDLTFVWRCDQGMVVGVEADMGQRWQILMATVRAPMLSRLVTLASRSPERISIVVAVQVPFVEYWRYTRDRGWAERVGYPFVAEALEFWECW